MGTRSLIGFEKNDGEVVASYCHWDGYLEHVGKQLITHYNTEIAAKDIAELGYISSLEDSYNETQIAAAHKERPSLYLDTNEYIQDLDDMGIEFIYLYRDSQWFYASCKDPIWHRVERALNMPA